ncbi:hypothetical protein D9M68_416520 [compost metagenome]
MDVDAGKPRRLTVGADGEEIAAKAAQVQEDIGRDRHHDHHPEQARHTEEIRAREVGEGFIGDRDRRTVGDQQADPAQRCQGRKRDDEGRQTHAHDAEGMEGADQHPEGEREDDGGPERHASRKQPGDDDAGEADHRPHRKIDAGGDDDEGLADREDGRHRPLAQQVADVVWRPKTVGGEAQQQPEEQKQPQEGEAEQNAHALAWRRAGAAFHRFRTHRLPPCVSQISFYVFKHRSPASALPRGSRRDSRG